MTKTTRRMYSLVLMPIMAGNICFPFSNAKKQTERFTFERTIEKNNELLRKTEIEENTYNFFTTSYQYIEVMKEFDRLNKELELKKKQELERQEQERFEQERIKKKKQEEIEAKTRNFILTFYTDLDCENGWGAITCEGKPLVDGIVANNVIPLHTKIYLEGYGEVVVADRGGSNFNTEARLDVFVPRNHGESDGHYLARVQKMGKQVVKGYYL